MSVLVITGGAGCTAIVSVADPVPLAFVALMVTGVAPTTVGVPLIAPVLVSMLNPGGSAVTLYKVGVFVAVIW